MDVYLKTLTMIREHNEKLNSLSDNVLALLYGEWSGIIASASWLNPNSRYISLFCEWATTVPCDRINKV